MASNDFRLWRASRVLAALVVLTGAAILAAPAQGASGHGTAALVLAKHDRGRTLSGQKVRVLAGAPAKRSGRTLELPISNVDPGAGPSATGEGWLRFKRGKRATVMTAPHFDLAAGTLNGMLGSEEIAVFRLGAATTANASSGSVEVEGGKLRLTSEAATVLKQRLRLPRALRLDGVGMVWLAARANPAHERRTIVSGNLGWGVLASWRAYVLGQQGPPMSVGGISVEGGATTNGTLSEAGASFGFPATEGSSFERGLYGAADRLVLRTRGSVTFAKPFHCIVEVKLADLEVTIDGPDSSIRLDSDYDIDAPDGMACNPRPPVATDDVTFAALDTSGIAPTWSADGRTVTWSAIPATLTAAGAAAFGTGHKAGLALDPVTVTVGLG